MKKFKSQLPALGLFLGLSTILAVGGLAYRNANALADSQHWVARAHEVIESVDEIQIAMNDAIARQIGHDLAGDEVQHQTYLEAVARVRQREAETYWLTRDNPQQQMRLDRLRPLVEARLARLDRSVHARRTLGLALAREGSDDDAQADRIQSLMEDTKQEERSLLTRRQQAEHVESAIAQRSMVIGFGASVCVLLVTFLQISRQSAHRASVALDNAGRFKSAERHGDDLREANQRMVSATIRAHELTEAAESAKTRAEKNEHELLEMAEFRERFIGILGHDLRNPLTSIAMSAGLLQQRGLLDSRDEQAVTRITRSCQRMTRMIAQLLDMTRARLGGGFPLEPKPSDLREICRNVIEEFSAPIQLEIEGDVTGTWDPDRLAEVLSNIAANGIEHATPWTALIVKVRAEGSGVVVEIQNQGRPIPTEALPFIFEPFRRAKPLERSPSGNLGLGLYIAKQIVLSHGGTLDAHSVDGATTFAMILPRRPGLGIA